MVTEDMAEPMVSVTSSNNIDCTNTNATLISTSSDTDLIYSWTGPGGFTSTDENAEITGGGIYILTVTGTNGCTTTVSYTHLTLPTILLV